MVITEEEETSADAAPLLFDRVQQTSKGVFALPNYSNP